MTYLEIVDHILATDYLPRHIISFSSGAPSAWMTYLVLKEHPEAIVVFADTLIEDDDNYRFLQAIKMLLGHCICRLSLGKTPLEVADDEGYAFIPNQLSATCTRKLKIELIMGICRPGDTVYLGFTLEDKAKRRDLNAPIENYAKIGVSVRYPLIENNVLQPGQLVKSLGLTLPRMYAMGYSHANCGGCCVKQGQGDWIRTLIHFPEKYAKFEVWEHRKRTKQAVQMLMIWYVLAMMPGLLSRFSMNKYRLYTFVRQQVDGIQVGISLRELRIQYELRHQQPSFFDMVDELNGGACTVECGVGNRDELALAVDSVIA